LWAFGWRDLSTNCEEYKSPAGFFVIFLSLFFLILFASQKMRTKFLIFLIVSLLPNLVFADVLPKITTTTCSFIFTSTTTGQIDCTTTDESISKVTSDTSTFWLSHSWNYGELAIVFAIFCFTLWKINEAVLEFYFGKFVKTEKKRKSLDTKF